MKSNLLEQVMRKFFIPLLMASVIMPAAAYARPDRDQSDEPKKEQSSDNRPQRAERANHSDRSGQVERSERPVRLERIERAQGEPRIDRQRVQQVQQVQEEQRVRRIRRSDGNMMDGIREVTRERHDRDNVEVRPGTDGSFTAIPSRTVERHDRTSDRHRWSGDWRRDHRYDWRNYRDRHRTLFRLGRYYDPYGWGYRRFSIGFSLGSSYYGSNYWLDDPWMYRLPPAYGPYRWVRYYDDALLVNIYTGQVVDVLYSFFW